MGGVTINRLTHRVTRGILMMRILVTLTIFFISLVCYGQGVPSNLQAAIFYKVLAYDYNIQTKSGDEITIYVVIDNKTTGQRDAIEAGFKKIAGQKLAGKTIKLAVITAGELDDAIVSSSGEIIYVPDGATDSTVTKVLQIARNNKHATLCGNEGLAERGVAIGLTVEGGKPKIVINLPASQAQGMKLSSKVLRLAKVIK